MSTPIRTLSGNYRPTGRYRYFSEVQGSLLDSFSKCVCFVTLSSGAWTMSLISSFLVVRRRKSVASFDAAVQSRGRQLQNLLYRQAM